VSLAARNALITGASSGIGAAFAEALAREHVNLALVARSERRLQELAQQLHSDHDVRVEVITCDLAREHAADEIVRRLGDLDMEIEMLINNAGFATQGRFDEIPGDRDHALVMVNVAAVVDLTHALAPAMTRRGTGTIINLASMGGFQPGPRLAVYAASKAFVLSFSQALAAELRDTGVEVMALCPGPVLTAFFDVLGSSDAAIGQQLSVEAVVTAALAKLGRRTVVVPGWRNRLTASATRLLPRPVVLALADRATRHVAAA
jgi:uncharacterized protein